MVINRFVSHIFIAIYTKQYKLPVTFSLLTIKRIRAILDNLKSILRNYQF